MAVINRRQGSRFRARETMRADSRATNRGSDGRFQAFWISATPTGSAKRQIKESFLGSYSRSLSSSRLLHEILRSLYGQIDSVNRCRSG
jgi:hypothetical protein